MSRLHERRPRRARIGSEPQQCAQLRRLPQQLAKNRHNRRMPIVTQTGGRSSRQSPPSRIDDRATDRERQPTRFRNRPCNMRLHIDGKRSCRLKQQPLLVLTGNRRRNPGHHAPPHARAHRRTDKSVGDTVRPSHIGSNPTQRSNHCIRHDQRPRFEIRRKPPCRPEADDARTPARHCFAQRAFEPVGARGEHDIDATSAHDFGLERHAGDGEHGHEHRHARPRIAHIAAVTRDKPSRVMFR